MTSEATARFSKPVPAFFRKHVRISPKIWPRKESTRRQTMLLRFVLGINLLVLLAGACAQNPATGRSEVSLISAEKEREIGAEEARKVEQVMGLVDDPKIVDYVQTVGRRLAQYSPRQDVEYRFHVVDMVEPNAFALPGGYIYISRGLLPLVNFEDELVGVMAHEIAHVAARHAVGRVNVSIATTPVRIAAGITGLATGILAPRLGQMVAGVGQVASGLVIASYSRDQERDADRIGQEIVSRAGWDPEALSTFLETLGREEKLHSGRERPNSFFATHPTTSDRVRKTSRHAADLTPAPREPIAENRADLFARLEGLLVGENPKEGVFVGNRFLQPVLDFSLHFPPGWKAQNGQHFVVAQAPREDALVLLQIAGEGDDPLQVVRALEEKLEARLLENTQVIQVNGLRAAHTLVGVRASGGKTVLDLTWVAHRGLVYQITGVSPLPRFEDYQGVFVESARTFNPLSPAERSEIEEARLRIVRAREDETLEELVGRVNSTWTPAQAAVANAAEEDTRLRDGQLIKVSVKQPCKTQTRPAHP